MKDIISEQSFPDSSDYGRVNSVPMGHGTSVSKLLNGILQANQLLLNPPDLENAIPQALAVVGSAAGVERLFAFSLPRSPTCLDAGYEWVNPALPEQDHDTLWKETVFSTFKTSLENSLENSLEQTERSVSKSITTVVTPGLMEPGVSDLGRSRRLLLLPIDPLAHICGCLAVLDGESRHWSTEEESALHLFATSIGQAWQQATTAQALQSSQSRFQHITTHVPGMIFQCLQQGTQSWTVIYASAACGSLWEVPPEAVPERLQHLLQQQSCGGMAHPDLTDSSWRWEGEIQTTTGDQRWVEAVLKPTPQAEGNVLWDGLLSDITERKRVEDERKRHEQRILDRETRLRRYNQVLMDLVRRQSLNAGNLQSCVQEILSISAQELEVVRASLWLFNGDRSAMTCFDLYERQDGSHDQGMQLSAQDYPRYFQALQTTRTIAVPDVYTDPRTQDFAQTYLPETGITSLLDAPIWVGNKLLGALCYEQVGEKRLWTLEEEHFVGAIADVVSLAIESVQRYWAESSLRDSEEKFSKAFNSIPDPITLSTLEEGRFIDVNDSFLRISGYQRQEVIGQTSQSLHLWKHQSDRDRVIAQLKAKQSVSNQEYPFCNHRGETWIGLYSAEIIQLGGIPCLLSIVRDITERKQAEAALQESEAKFKKAFRCSPHPSLILTLAEGRPVDVNDAYLEMTGFQRREVIGRNGQDLKGWMNPQDYDRVVAHLQQDGMVRNWELLLHTRNGEARSVLFSAELVTIQGLTCMLCMANDITERLQAEHQRRESEEKFSKAFLASPDCLAISTLEDGRYLEVNDTLVRVLGLPRKEIIGKTSTELHIWAHTQDREHFRQTLARQGSARDLEYEFRTGDGELRVGLVSAEIIQIRGDTANATLRERCILSLVRDITERKQSEIQMQLAARRDRLLAETLSRIRASLDLQQILHTTVTEVRQFLQADRVFIGHRDDLGEISIACESLNPIYPSVLSWQPHNPPEWRSLLDSHQTSAVEDTAQERLNPDFPPIVDDFYQEYQVRSILAVPIRLPDQGVIGSLVVNQCSKTRNWQPMEIDLLEQLAVQVAIAMQQAQLYSWVRCLNSNLERQVADRTQALAQKIQEVQELYQLKDLFLHAVSHDLRTPVMGWLLVLKNLLTTDSTSATIAVPRRVLQRMTESSDRQLHLINSLLEVHSSEARGIILHPEPLNLRLFISGILEDLDPLLHKYQAIAQMEIAPDLPSLRADPLALRRVFENLLTNALHHNPPGLTLTLTVSQSGDSLHCTLQDNGVGMTPEQCETLFELYQRGQRARQSTGIGLGLYLCQQIITAHGGEIGVSSTPGLGATFWFTLPLSAPPDGIS